MNKKLTIVMYHYVRDLKRSRYPGIKGLETADFLKQIEYIQKRYTVVTAEEVMTAVEGKTKLPANALWLTFDDGYLDHYTEVFPILDEKGIQGSFFIPAKAVLEGEMLDVNKIHFILVSAPNKKKLVNDIYSWIDKYRSRYHLRASHEYYKNTEQNNRFDLPEVIFIKNMLQKELPKAVREKIIEELFRKYVSEDEEAFAQELYMDLAQIRCLRRKGMFIGSHSYDHVWMNTLDSSAQEKEVQRSIGFLKETGADLKNWIFCYPYGAYNENLLSILKKYHCKIGLSSEVRIADLSQERALCLPRIDTNDLPKR